ncbi:hypothetical protein ABEB36_014967 [Hypothenemus hampei]|uniref:Reverse transcriptase domain-containing protein n=1 Tax=Hypothenemus hampei TaxID=57062 RepID=A0ABD1E618_HYPHA
MDIIAYLNFINNVKQFFIITMCDNIKNKGGLLSHEINVFCHTSYSANPINSIKIDLAEAFSMVNLDKLKYMIKEDQLILKRENRTFILNYIDNQYVKYGRKLTLYKWQLDISKRRTVKWWNEKKSLKENLYAIFGSIKFQMKSGVT